MIRLTLLLGGLWLATGSLASAASPDQARAMGLVQGWVTGIYSNAEQAHRSQTDPSLPDDFRHRLMHQLFVPVPFAIPGLAGHIVFQQSSVDGSEDPETITRVGLLQFLPDADGEVIRQRELNFSDVGRWRNAHRNPERFRTLDPAELRHDPGCDFLLRPAPDGRSVGGRIPAGTCRFYSQGMGRELVADDEVTISADEYWFLGRFVDQTGRVVWGNASPEPVKLRRLAPARAGGVLVFGGTRGTGLEVIRQLVSRGDAVTAFVRPGSDRATLQALGVRLVEGDALDAGDVRRAINAGIYRAAISTLGCRGCKSPPDLIGNRHVIDAARAGGVGRVIMVSTIGAGDSADAPPWIARWMLRDTIALKTAAEDYLRKSGLRYTIVRPGGLKDGPATGRGLLTEDRTAMGIITRADVAALIISTLDDHAAAGRTYAATDPGMQWPWDLF